MFLLKDLSKVKKRSVGIVNLLLEQLESECWRMTLHSEREDRLRNDRCQKPSEISDIVFAWKYLWYQQDKNIFIKYKC